MKKYKSRLVSIVHRERLPKGVIRELDCGHAQWEPRGGKARLATSARCKECMSPDIEEVTATEVIDGLNHALDPEE